ncbi:MAG TPA: ABC transporter permease [Acidobacteriota bacterium]|jgi:simple sugar transport system permease protein|nr:ABC transporter permease [Acidobacteriota bacterium]HNR38927.1 ABC transporter permease [Acidobacteriota bacterium]HNU00593.1 ABC transporter permease [Acidobacteriota bacterium]HPB28245.1 ABC transporter permease [Acidobacteriota bacterium]HQO24406.1 ABC transporter permease [Acidobacteriota bacterium]
MDWTAILLTGLAGVLATAGPLVMAAIGEALSERAGVVNLSLNGTLILSAMTGFAVAVATGSLTAGFLGGAVVGAAAALLVAVAGITLRQSQVAVGFVLALTLKDLAYFLGTPVMGAAGPRLDVLPVPLLERLPVVGPLLFRQDVMTYASFLLIAAAWVWIYRTRPGLTLRGLGEQPAAAFVRGADVTRLRYLYTVAGGALVGLAGPMYSLSVKAGWKGTISGLDGLGWIALALTIFGGWHPLRIAAGAYLFAFLQWLGVILQPFLPGIPSQVLQVAPFPFMILTLVLVNVGQAEWTGRLLALLPEGGRRRLAGLLRLLRANPPAALGQTFERE